MAIARTSLAEANETAVPNASIALEALVVSAAAIRPSEESGFQLLANDAASSTRTTGTYLDLFEQMPGGYIGSPSGSAFSLRGMAQDNTASYPGTGSNPLIQVMENGAPLSPATLRYLPPVTWDIAAVEIHYGPHFLIPGPVGLGGMIELQRQTAGFANDGSAIMEVGSANTLRVGISQDMVLRPDELALRLTAYHDQSEGDSENLFRKDDGFGSTERDRIEARLLWLPGKDRDRIVELSLVGERSDGNPFARVQQLPGYNLFDRKTSLNITPGYPADRFAATLQTRFALPQELILETATSAQRLQVDQQWDPDFTSLLNWVTIGRTEEQRFTQSLTLARNEGAFHWLLGAYAEISDYDVGFSGSGYFPTPAGIPFVNLAREDVRIAALYGKADWEFAPQLHLTGGLRLNHEERALENSSTIGAFPTMQSKGTRDGTDLQPSLGLSWQNENGDSNARLRIIHGTRAGGISYAHSLGLIQPYDPESDTMLELSAGIKPQPDFTFTASLFQSWIRDQQIPFKVPGGLQDIDTLVTNAARSRRRGVTLASIWQPLEGLIFSGNLAWTHTEFTSFDDEGINRSGQMFPNVPAWTASLAASYRHSSGWFGNLRASRADSSYSDLRNPEKSALESRELLSARLGYGWDHGSVYLFGNNLLDDQYLLQRADNTSSGLPPSGLVGPPRMLGVGAEFRW